ncbi:phospholipase A2 inhibitor and Ly6/PLAUR domain-containing protein-like [Rana temporaria]|uniref:phospholipase A2 inhibitor and Ly6/PLAUR domain-containing protein-like n=1 Tax=Rana temporaria TaxID=8407 RepID=UPI001AAC6AAF|nr:phospholipase A2 inhibitor and Ly6/PLAUR domain-containing protein-like [Rana temporaria]
MTMALVGLLVLFALVPSGFSLSCIKCINFSGTICTGNTETCTSGSSCATSLSTTTLGSTVASSTLTRGCSPINQCNITGSLTFTGGNVAIATVCCDTDSCASAIPTLPTASTTSNNQTCSTCASSTNDYCSSSDTLQCKGLETQCGRLSTSVKSTTGSPISTSVIRGCATPSVCNLLGNQQVTYSDQSVNVAVTTFCSNGSFNLRGSFYLPAFTAFFLFKFLF